MAPVPSHFDHEKVVIIETDASDSVSACLFSQHDNKRVLHLVAYYPKKHTLASCNYDIYHKELMAIVKALEGWSPEYEGAANPSQLITDHKKVEYFMTKKLLNRWQAKWSIFLTHFEYDIVH